MVHQFYHADPENPDSEEVGFTHVSQYRNFLKTHGLFREKAHAVVITGQMDSPPNWSARRKVRQCSLSS